MDSGILLTGIGCLLMGAGLASSFWQRRQQQQERIETDDIKGQLADARLVKEDMEALLTAAAKTGEEIVNDLRQEVLQAQKVLKQIETQRTAAMVGSMELPSDRENKLVDQAKLPRPFYIQEYLRNNEVRGKRTSAPTPSPNPSVPPIPMAPIVRAEAHIKALGEGEPKQWSKSKRYEQVPVLFEFGLTDEEVAQFLHIGKGEVQLVSQLRRRA
ncbi:hypothetical protein H1S01_02810 [Heliobacterium chlorum]|uniref:Uncharacterized protein n=1 Tax=Heliobacterium chlorum TaxID=2698 RepID=A0ABR7T0F1_HELCL|nr:hypothetical protein [Heliobacterium chlorum]MBC9783443.1 hypothetical protein [Heliobacterium chlorum]